MVLREPWYALNLAVRFAFRRLWKQDCMQFIPSLASFSMYIVPREFLTLVFLNKLFQLQRLEP